MDGDVQQNRLEEIMARFGGVSVLVVGDLVLDKYTVGKPVRISREAPIAVLEFAREYAVPGGGSSPACSVVSLGGRSYLTGVVGVDDEAHELLMELAAYGVDTGGIIADPSRPTTRWIGLSAKFFRSALSGPASRCTMFGVPRSFDFKLMWEVAS